MNAEYALVLAGCLLITLPLDLVWRLNVYARWRLLLRVALVVMPAFLIWDAAVAARGWWEWNPRFTLSLRLIGIPLEEIAFFAVIPICSILTWEVVHVVLDKRRGA